MRIALIGSNGQLARDIAETWPQRFDCRFLPFDLDTLDISRRDRVMTLLEEAHPDLVVSCAAFHRVDLCETEVTRTYEVNVIGHQNLAEFCLAHGLGLMYFSTDYVFDGKSSRPYIETDLAHPLSVYGHSKLAAEFVVSKTLEKHWVIRTSALYGLGGATGRGGNFVDVMLMHARKGRPLRVVDDQVVTPTSTLELARTMAELVDSSSYGLFHASALGETSWYEFARRVFEETGVEADLSPVSSAEYGAAARRPPYSVLENRALSEAGIRQHFTEWTEGLKRHVQALKSV